MALETADFISQLNESNPVGSSDLVSQGDDHLRLVKKVLRQSFPNISGEVTLSHGDLNALAPIVGGEIPDEWLSDNVPLLDQNNTFTATQELSATTPALRFIETDTSARYLLAVVGGVFTLRREDGGTVSALNIEGDGSGNITDIRLLADNVELNGVPSSDFARLSQPNAFEGEISIDAFLRFTNNQRITWEDTGGANRSLVFLNGSDNFVLGDSGFPTRLVGATVTYNGDEVGFRRLVNIRNGNYTLQASDAGHGVAKHSGGGGETWTVPDNTFQTGDVVPLFVLSGPLTVSPGTGVQLFHAGTGSSGSVTIEPPGFASLYFPGPGAAYIGGIGVFP